MTNDFATVEKKLAMVNVKHGKLPEARANALRAALGGRKIAEVFGEIFPAEAVNAQLVRAHNYLRAKDPLCVPLHHAVLLEHHLKLAGGTIYIALYHTEEKNFDVLKKEYGLMANPTSIKPGDDVPAAPLQGPLTLAQERLMALRHAMQAKGWTNANKLARNVHPKDDKKYGALSARMLPTLKGMRMLTEVDIQEIANPLGVAPSALLVRKDDQPAPAARRPTNKPEAASDAGTPVAAAPINGAAKGLPLSLGVGTLVTNQQVNLTSYDAATRTFSPPDGTHRARLCRQGERCFLEITTTADIPPDRLGTLLDLILPPQE